MEAMYIIGGLIFVPCWGFVSIRGQCVTACFCCRLCSAFIYCLAKNTVLSGYCFGGFSLQSTFTFF